jgi:XTP/dITP diphosphohydrolase
LPTCFTPTIPATVFAWDNQLPNSGGLARRDVQPLLASPPFYGECDLPKGTAMPRIVLGSRNRKKLQEMLALLGDLGLELTDLTPYPDAPEVEETADTFLGNATLKATQLAVALNAWVIGEDSGLCVPALAGAPGVFSARFAGVHGDDAANNAKLLHEMAALTGDDRAAYYVCAAVLADPTGKVVASVEGECHGFIADASRGTGGSATIRSSSSPIAARPSANCRPR